MKDASEFFHTYYAPNNAVLVVTGDIDIAATRAWIAEYFGGIPSADVPRKPDLTEPRQTAEKRFTRVDSLATRPAIGVAYHVPDRFTPEWYAFGLIDQLLAQGRDSRLYQELVQKRGLTGGVDAGINFGLGNMYDYQGPMLWEMQAFHDADKPADTLVAAIDAAIEPLRTTLGGPGDARARTDEGSLRALQRDRAVRRIRTRTTCWPRSRCSTTTPTASTSSSRDSRRSRQRCSSARRRNSCDRESHDRVHRPGREGRPAPTDRGGSRMRTITPRPRA